MIFLDVYIICRYGPLFSDCHMACIHDKLSIHFSRHECPDYFHLHTTLNSTAMGVLVVFCIDRGVISLGYKTRAELLPDNSILSPHFTTLITPIRCEVS